MRHVPGRRDRMARDGYALGQSSVRKPWSPEAFRVFPCAGEAPDIPSYRAYRAWEERGGVVLALNNLQSPGDSRLCRTVLLTRCVQPGAEADPWQVGGHTRGRFS